MRKPVVWVIAISVCNLFFEPILKNHFIDITTYQIIFIIQHNILATKTRQIRNLMDQTVYITMYIIAVMCGGLECYRVWKRCIVVSGCRNAISQVFLEKTWSKRLIVICDRYLAFNAINIYKVIYNSIIQNIFRRDGIGILHLSYFNYST